MRVHAVQTGTVVIRERQTVFHRVRGEPSEPWGETCATRRRSRPYTCRATILTPRPGWTPGSP
jgi:hypothetical protein